MLLSVVTSIPQEYNFEYSLYFQTGILISRSWTLRDGLVLSGIAVTFHFLSILYLRFAYHKVYEGEYINSNCASVDRTITTLVTKCIMTNEIMENMSHD